MSAHAIICLLLVVKVQDAGSKSFGGNIQSASKSDDVQLFQGLLERHSLGKDDKRLLESLADGTLHDSLSSGELTTLGTSNPNAISSASYSSTAQFQVDHARQQTDKGERGLAASTAKSSCGDPTNEHPVKEKPSHIADIENAARSLRGLTGVQHLDWRLRKLAQTGNDIGSDVSALSQSEQALSAYQASAAQHNGASNPPSQAPVPGYDYYYNNYQRALANYQHDVANGFKSPSAVPPSGPSQSIPGAQPTPVALSPPPPPLAPPPATQPPPPRLTAPPETQPPPPRLIIPPQTQPFSVISAPAPAPKGPANSTIISSLADLAALTANGTLDCTSTPTPYIAGGATTTTVRYPYAISLRAQQDNGLWISFCSGILIESQLILTAAHCCQLNTEDTSAKYLDIQTQNGGVIPENKAPKAFLGATCVAGDGIDSQLVQNVYPSPGWTGDVAGGFDVCIMKMAREFELKPENTPPNFRMTYPRLSNSTADSSTTGLYKAIGWGLMNGLQVSPQLREATLTQLLWETCKAVFDRGDNPISVTQAQLCTQPSGGNTTCKGDSGGPLIKINSTNDHADGDVIVGIVSAGDSFDCRAGSGNTLYSSVNAFNNPITTADTQDTGRCSPEALKQVEWKSHKTKGCD